VALYSHTLGVSTCFIGGYKYEDCMLIDGFNDKKDHFAILSPIGYYSKFEPFLSLVMSFIRSRKNPSDLFFNETFGMPLDLNKEEEHIKTILECVRWAPSSVNSQTTRIVKIGKDFHFYKDSVSNYYSKMAIGISSANWECACKELNIKTSFSYERNPRIEIPSTAEYFITWTIE
jgi:nitroreductase